MGRSYTPRRLGVLALIFCAALGSTAVRADGIDGSLGFGTDKFPQPDPQRGVFGPPPGAGPGFDPDMFSMADQAIGFISSGVQDAIRKRLEVPKAAGAAGAPQFGTSGIGFGTVSVGGWTQVFGLTQPQQRSDRLDRSDGVSSGALIGFDMLLSDRTIGGLFLGGATATLGTHDRTHDLSVNSFYGGFYLSHVADGYFVDIALTGGRADHDSMRLVDDGDYSAEASYDGYFLNPSFTVSTTTHFAGRPVKPSLRLHYAGSFFDAYAESGSAALRIDRRQSHVAGARAKVTVPFQRVLPNDGVIRIETRGGIDAGLNLSPDTTASAADGRSFSAYSADQDRFLGAFLGADMSYRFYRGLSVFGGFEGVVYSSKTVDAYGRIGAQLMF